METSLPPPPDLDWLKLREEMDGDDARREGFVNRLKRKFTEQPLVPIGIFATVCALTFGLYNFKKGNSRMSQYMMRARVAAQGFTILVAVGSTMIAAQKKKDAEAAEDAQVVTQPKEKK